MPKIKKLTPLEIENNIIFDLYLSGKDGNVPNNEDIEKVEKLLPSSLKLEKLEKNLKEKNYGRGADWPVVLIEWLNNNYFSATLNFLSLVIIGKNVFNLIKDRPKEGNLIFLGVKSASYIGFYYINKNFPDKEFTLLSSIEIERGSFASKKEFVIIFTEKNSLHDNDPQLLANADNSIFGELIIIHLDWDGNLKSFYVY